MTNPNHQALTARSGELQPGERLLRLPEVLKIIPVSRSEWYRRLQSGEAPQPVQLGPRARAWRLSDVNDYLLELATRGRAKGGANR